jgi:hypothetical protein
MMSWKGFGRNRLWPTRAIIPRFTWRNLKKQQNVLRLIIRCRDQDSKRTPFKIKSENYPDHLKTTVYKMLALADDYIVAVTEQGINEEEKSSIDS